MDLPNNQRPAADGNKSEKKKIFRRRIGGTGKPAATANTGLNANNILNVRKALKIPSNFDAFAAKQMTSFKHSKAQEMFKERTKKFTCVEDDREQQRGGYSASTADGEEQTSYHTGIAFPISASLDLLDEKEREAIREYEERKNRKQPFTSSFAEFSAATSSSAFPPLLAIGEGPEIFSTIPPFDPRIPPPVFPNQMATAFLPKKPVETPPTVEANQQPPQASRSVKQEAVELSIVDEIPSFQSSPSTSNLPPPPTNPIKTEAEFREDDCKKRKQALLWSLCEEELTVDSSIDTSTRRLDQISKKIEHYQKALTAEETQLKELKEKKTKLLTRRKRLLMSVEDSGGGAGTKEKR